MVRALVLLAAIAFAVALGYFLRHEEVWRGRNEVVVVDPPPSRTPEPPAAIDVADKQRARTRVEPPPAREELPAPSPGRLLIPVRGIRADALRDMFDETRPGARPHEAIDIMAPRGTPVLAVADGVIRKLFTSKPGGLTIYQFDENEEYSFYYAHLDGYADSVQEGKQVKRGQVIGYVGSTGNADPNGPHLHFAVFRLDEKKNWWQGQAVNPYPLLTRR